jgi:hypothetical protein
MKTMLVMFLAGAIPGFALGWHKEKLRNILTSKLQKVGQKLNPPQN